MTLAVLKQCGRAGDFGPYGHAESKKTQKFVFRSALRPNQISFSHDQDPKRPSDVARMRQVAGAETAIPHGRGGLLPQKSSVILGTQERFD